MIVDLTPVLGGTGRARLLDLVPARSAAALKTWFAAQSSAFRDQIDIVAMDGFSGYKTAAAAQLPEATPVMDPFHVVALAGAKLDLCRQRIQQLTCGHRGRAGDPLYGFGASCGLGYLCSVLVERPGWKRGVLALRQQPISGHATDSAAVSGWESVEGHLLSSGIWLSKLL